jgi:hypothetical protein
MKSRKMSFALIFVMMIFSINIGLSYGQVYGVAGLTQGPSALPMTVTTDKQYYSDGDKITVSGTVEDSLPGTAITIKIRSSNNNIVFIGQTPLSDGGVFSTTFTTGGNLWQDAGKYEIVAKIGNKDAVTTFQFGGYVPFGIIQVEGTDLSISYKIVGGQLLNIHPNIQNKSLVLSVKAVSNGTLTISLPRSVIDSKTDGEDAQFVVIINGITVSHAEQPGSLERTLTIPFSNETKEVTIVGTKVIPEFGSIVGLVFAVTILSVILIFTKFGSRLTRLR